MITAFQATRIAGLLYSKPSCVANAALPRPLGAKSTHAVLCLRPGKRKHVQKGTLKTYSESQAINFQSGSGSNAQPTVQFPVESIKSNLQREIDGTKRGIFGTKAAKSQAIEDLLQQLEEQTPALNVTEAMDQLNGGWQLLYTSLTIKGARKTKLGLREFVTLGDFRQTVDTGTNRAVNKVCFSVTGLGNLSGSLTIIAAFEPVSPRRVSINFESASLVPQALEKLFASNYDLLLSIFNPEGWLDITYVDETHRVGRDDKGNVFYLQRC
ncbi:hypothetical protein ABBQ38_009191 [Trebouxia sp. C0009 RCD-2024]